MHGANYRDGTDKYSQEKNTSKVNHKLKLQNSKVEKEAPMNTVFNYYLEKNFRLDIWQ